MKAIQIVGLKYQIIKTHNGASVYKLSPTGGAWQLLEDEQEALLALDALANFIIRSKTKKRPKK